MSGALKLRLSSDQLVAEWCGRGASRWTGERTLDSRDELAAALDDLLSHTELAGQVRRLRVEVTTSVVQLRTLRDLPPVRSSALPMLVQTQASRFFRRNGAPLVTAARWAPGRRGSRSVVAVAIEAPWLAELGAAAARHGIADLDVVPEVAPELALRLPAWDAARGAAGRRRLRRALLLAALSWAAVLGVDSARLARERVALNAEMAALEPGSSAVRRAAQQAETAVLMVDAIALADARRRASLRVLGQLLGALPQGASLSRLTWEETGAGTLVGSAPSATALLAALEASAAADSVRQLESGPRSMTQAGERETFTISFRRGDVP